MTHPLPSPLSQPKNPRAPSAPRTAPAFVAAAFVRAAAPFLGGLPIRAEDDVRLIGADCPYLPVTAQIVAGGAFPSREGSSSSHFCRERANCQGIAPFGWLKTLFWIDQVFPGMRVPGQVGRVIREGEMLVALHSFLWFCLILQTDGC